MPNSNTKFSSEKIYLTHNTVTKEISYTISKDVKLFVLQGSAGSSYKIKLNIEDGTTPLLIYLVDFNSQVLRGDVISAQGRTISIWSYGDSRLTGCNDTMPSNTPNKGENVRDFANRTNNDHETSTGGAAIKANDVYIHGDSLFLQGGRGANGSGVGIKNIYTTVLYTYFTGERCGNGGAGIMALGKVDIQIRGLEVYGGTGGNGNDRLSFVLKNPGTTSCGEVYAGMYGGNGGRGGYGGDVYLLVITNLPGSYGWNTILGKAGMGGSGGAGGDGGIGGNGGWAGHKGEDGILDADGGVGTII